MVERESAAKEGGSKEESLGPVGGMEVSCREIEPSLHFPATSGSMVCYYSTYVGIHGPT